MTQMNLSVKQKQTDTESRFGAAAGEGKREGMDWEFRISRCKL